MENKIKLSIITPVLNKKDFIEDCIQTFLGQNCPAAEHIIIDGLSTDGTVGIIKKYANKYPGIRWVSKKDKGQSDAMNKGIAMARGEIISFLNADDFYQPNVLNRALEIFTNLKAPSFVYGNVIIWHEDNDGNYFPNNLWKPKYFTFEDLILNHKKNMHPPNPSGYFYHKSLHEVIGGYDVKLNFTLDADFLFRVFRAAKSIKYIDETWGNYLFIKNTKTYNNSIGDKRNGWSIEEKKYYLKLISKYKKKFRLQKGFWRRCLNFMKRAVVTCINDNMAKNLAQDFLPTLKNNAGFTGDIFLMYYGRKVKKIQKLLRDYNVKIFPFAKKIDITSQRHIDFLELLKKIPEETDQLIFIDSGDVWFQSPIDEIFTITKNNCGFVEENIMADGQFNASIINQISDENIRADFLKEASGPRLINGGMLAGNRKDLAYLIGKVAAIRKKIGQDFYALDQAILNYIIRKWDVGIALPEKFNFVVITQKAPIDIRNGTVLDKKGRAVCVVHNAGNSHRYFSQRIGFKPPPKFETILNGDFWGITVFFNLSKNKNKIKIYRKFRESLKKQGLKLLAVEAVLNGASPELEANDAEIVVRLRTNSVLWQKERLLNEALLRLPKNCDKIVWIDCDIIFSNNNWVEETSKLLESYCIVQPFQYYVRLPENIDCIVPEKTFLSNADDAEGYKLFGAGYRISQLTKNILGKDSTFFGHPGFAWAARREIFDKIGFLDRIVLPAADLFMLRAFYNRGGDYYNEEMSKYLPNWACEKYFIEWSDKMKKAVKGSVYYTDGFVLHLWHGKLQKRTSDPLVEILKKYNFNPKEDIKIGRSGCWEWANKKEDMHRLIKENFSFREADERKKNNEKGLLNLAIKIGRKTDSVIGLFGVYLKKQYPFTYKAIRKSKAYDFLIKTRDTFLFPQ